MPFALLRVAASIGSFAALVMPVSAQIITDGSVGPARTLAGPTMEIGADLGRQIGGNLFHSFNRFNVGTGETASFSGPASVANIIGRVTGGSPSSINGTIQSTIAGANLFLFNPAGMAFGPGAFLNVSGSFHASTGDYLRFGDGVRFEARSGNGSSFTAAPPAAFGFLNANPAAIAINGSQLGVPGGNALSFIGGPLSVSGEAFLLATAGGNINLSALASPGEALLQGGRFEVGGAARLADIAFDGSSAFVQGGEAGAITVRGANLTLDRSLINAFAENARSVPIDIRLTGDLTARSAGIGAGQFTAGGVGTPGNITISARNVRFVDSSVISTNFGASRGGDMAINATEAVELTSIAADGFAAVTSQTGASGRAGDITVAAPRTELTGRGAEITARAAVADTGNGGNIIVTTGRLILRGGATIGSDALTSTGASAGSIRVDASQSVLLTGFFLIEVDGLITPSSSALNTSSAAGTAGDLVVTTPHLRLEGGELSSSTSRGQGGNILLTVGRLELTDNGRRGADISTDVVPNIEGLPLIGNAGNVMIVAREAVVLTDNSLPPLLNTPSSVPVHSSISSSNTGSGRPGSVSISTPSLDLAGQTSVSALTAASGPAGSVTIRAARVTVGTDSVISVVSGPDATGDAGSIAIDADSVLLTGGGFLSSTTAGAGRGGNITVSARDNIEITGRTQFASPFPGSGIFSRTRGTQTGGTIAASARMINIADVGTINAGSSGPGDAGSITLKATDTISIRSGGTVSTEAAAGGGGDIAIQAGRLFHVDTAQVTTSVAGGTGSGGNISIDPDFVVLNNARIQANAFGGNGGNITIVAGQFLSSPSSVVEASSQLGISGTINIQAPDSNVTGSLAELSGKFFDASTVRREGCSGPARAEREPSSLVASGRGGLPPDGTAQRPAGYFAGRDRGAGKATSGPPRQEQGASKPVLRISCR